jgi:type II secretory pathway predicted ATPase ExeA
MYRLFYNLNERPFQISTQPEFLWLGETHKEALSVLKYGVMSRNGILALTGDVGTGKTTLINALLADLNSNVIAANIVNSNVDMIGFLNMVGQAFNIFENFDRIENFIFRFTKFLKQKYSQSRHVLLVVDEAHKLSKDILEQIRLFSNIEIEGQSPISIFLVGQNELNNKLLSRDCRALRQRITIHYQLQPLSKSETLEYCKYRLAVAGGQNEIFDRQAMLAIYRFSRGYPRLINVVCERALIAGYAEGVQKIGLDIIKECGRELRLPGEILINMKTDLNDMLAFWRRSPSRVYLQTKTNTIYRRFNKQTKRLMSYLGIRLKSNSLLRRFKTLNTIEFNKVAMKFVQFEKPKERGRKTQRQYKNIFLKKHNWKRALHDFAYRIKKMGLKDTALTIGLIILVVGLSLLYFRSFSIESNLKLSGNLVMQPKVPVTGVVEYPVSLNPEPHMTDTAAAMVSVIEPSIIPSPPESNAFKGNTKKRTKRLFIHIVEQIEESNDTNPQGSVENESKLAEFVHNGKGENINSGEKSKKELIIAEKTVAQFSAQNFTDSMRQDAGLDWSVPGYSSRTRMAYSIQVGAYIIERNAIKMARELEKRGYEVNIVKFSGAKGRVWHTVRLGAYISSGVAKRKAEDFSSKENIESIVRPTGRL